MDAGSIELILTGLTAAGGAGVIAGVQQVAGDAVKDSYHSLIKGVTKLLTRRRAASDVTVTDPVQPEPAVTALIAAHQAGSCEATIELRRLLAAANSAESLVQQAASLFDSPQSGSRYFISNSTAQINDRTSNSEMTVYVGVSPPAPDVYIEPGTTTQAADTDGF